jgi:cysteine desulfurase
MIYLDNNATTPIHPSVFEAMRPYLTSEFGNPSSAHAPGRAARRVLTDAREAVAGLLGAASSEEIVFTSGGTESDNWAILGGLESLKGGDEIITTRVEHEAVRKSCERLENRGRRVTWLDVDEHGALDLDQLISALGSKTAIVSVMMANNETGVLFPVGRIAEIVKERSDALVHVDGVNAAGKVPIDLKNTAIDLFSISGHKFHGPKGVGALYIRSGTDLPSASVGGGQEFGRRAGTEAVHQIAGIGAAAKLVSNLAPMGEVRILRDRLEQTIMRMVPHAYLNGTPDAHLRLPNTSNISFEDTNGEVLMTKLDDEGICVSTGSACNSESHETSVVLQAMDIPFARAMGSIRFSLGRTNTAEEIDRVLTVLPDMVAGLRTLSV